MGIANGKDRDLLKKKIKEIKTGVEKEKKIQEKERKAKEKEQKKQLLKKKWGQPLRDWVTVSNIDSERAFYTVAVWYSSRCVVFQQKPCTGDRFILSNLQTFTL